jgi:hypothetical protein
MSPVPTMISVSQDDNPLLSESVKVKMFFKPASAQHGLPLRPA